MDERLRNIARVVDISGVRTDVSRQEIDALWLPAGSIISSALLPCPALRRI